MAVPSNGFTPAALAGLASGIKVYRRPKVNPFAVTATPTTPTPRPLRDGRVQYP